MAAPRRPHVARDFDLAGLNGISDRTLETHFALYRGYVQALNEVEERLDAMDASELTGAPEHLELVKRREFESGGMTLHELYFDNLQRQGGEPDGAGAFAKLVEPAFEGLDGWRKDFEGIAGTRGIGWVVVTFDAATDKVANHWVWLHEIAKLEGATPLLVMDLWEHAWMLDHGPTERAKHVAAFLENVRWGMVDHRAVACAALSSAGRPA